MLDDKLNEGVEDIITTPEFTGDGMVDDLPEPPEQTTTDLDDDNSGIRNFAKVWFEKNAWEWDDGFLKEDTVESLTELLNDIVAENAKPEYSSKVVADFDDYVRNGGDPRNFLSVMFGDEDPNKYDLTDPFHQKRIIERYYTETTKYKPEKIQSLIKRTEATGELDADANEALEYFKQKEANKATYLQQQAKQQQELQKKQYEDGVAELRNYITKVPHIGGFELSEKERKEFFEYVLKRDNKGKTQYEIEAQNNPDLNIQLAFFAYKKLHKQELQKKMKTEATRDLKQQLGSVALKTKGHVQPKQNSIDDLTSIM